jgi:tetrahydromethanopterin S-methyltransferase subunit G
MEQIERRIDRLERVTENVNVTQSEVTNLRGELHDLSEEVGALRKAIITAALSFVVGALILALSISQVLT